jgi:phosphoglycolate phosphatase-like HAD superfamily hydrolase
MIALFWDIDGTLLSTGKAGVMPWEAAVRTVTGRDFQLSSMRIPGLTDYQIAVRTFEMLEVQADEAEVQRLVRLYEDGLPAALPLRQGFVMPNVREILEHCGTRPDVRSYLLTGNTRRGARAKLTHYDLFKYFPDGGFAEDPGPRSQIACRAIELARRDAPITGGSAFVIGDTPHDIECGHAIGARTIAVATGGYSIDELTPHDPWLAVEQLPPPAEFLRLIDEAVAAAMSDIVKGPIHAR